MKSANFLNEVLSLNAQESDCHSRSPPLTTLLNEVLSLNAQEYDAKRLTVELDFHSSMKS